jgi:hypothetical protein
MQQRLLFVGMLMGLTGTCAFAQEFMRPTTDTELGAVESSVVKKTSYAPSVQNEHVNPPLCGNALIQVAATSEDERRLLCGAINHTLELLGRCDILLRRPLRVQVMDQVRHPLSKVAIFGLFDVNQEKVLITREETIAALVKGTPYAELPQRQFYRSLIVHEVTHGVMHQNFKRKPMNHAAFEYPAYVLQLASLPAHVRDSFLRSIPSRARPGEFIFNDAVLFFDPFFFAAHAYEHFESANDGCAQLQSLLDGQASFVPWLYP